MISRHIDFVAIGILLAAIALFSGAKQVVVMTMGGPVHYFRVESGREIRIPAIPQVPAVPRVPRIPLQND